MFHSSRICDSKVNLCIGCNFIVAKRKLICFYGCDWFLCNLLSTIDLYRSGHFKKYAAFLIEWEIRVSRWLCPGVNRLWGPGRGPMMFVFNLLRSWCFNNIVDSWRILRYPWIIKFLRAYSWIETSSCNQFLSKMSIVLILGDVKRLFVDFKIAFFGCCTNLFLVRPLNCLKILYLT